MGLSGNGGLCWWHPYILATRVAGVRCQTVYYSLPRTMADIIAAPAHTRRRFPLDPVLALALPLVTFLTFAASICLWLAGFSTPFIKRIYYLGINRQGGSTRFGTFGYCYGVDEDRCIPRAVGVSRFPLSSPPRWWRSSCIPGYIVARRRVDVGRFIAVSTRLDSELRGTYRSVAAHAYCGRVGVGRYGELFDLVVPSPRSVCWILDHGTHKGPSFVHRSILTFLLTLLR